MNRENLLKLAEGLEGPLRAEFTMWRFAAPLGLDRCIDGLTSCGTAGCAVGHASYLVAPKSDEEDWYEFSERLFGLMENSAEWLWCFGADWSEVDNTPKGAAARIRWFLGHGVPENCEEQMYGGAPLCYATPEKQA